MGSLAFDAASNGTPVNPGTSVTFSHTCTGTNLLLIVGVTVEGGNPPPDCITGVTYNTVAMTKLNSTFNNVNNGDRTYLYGLVNPATGAHDVVVSSDTSLYIATSATSYSGASQAGVPGTTAVANDDTAQATFDVPITTPSDQCWVVGVVSDNGNGGPTATSAYTARTDSGQRKIFDTNADITPAGSSTLSVSSAAGSIWTGVLAAIVPATTTSANHNLGLLGVGT